MRSSDNRLVFEKDIGNEPLATLAALHDLVVKKGYSDIVLDFSLVTRLRPELMLPVVAIARKYRSSKVEFDIVFPNERRAHNFLKTSGWLHLIAPEKYDLRTFKVSGHLAAMQFRSPEEHTKAVNNGIDLILSNNQIARSELKALEWSLNEITDNVLNHSECKFGGIVQVFNSKRAGSVDFYVVDSGITIPKSLMSSVDGIQGEIDALRRSIQEGVTRNKKTNQGNGLFGTFRCCEVSGGEFEILSGRAHLHFKNGNLNVTRNLIPFEGTFIKASIKNNAPDLLGRALVFKGRKHVPGFDYIERIYQSESEIMTFKVASEIPAFGSRSSGRHALQKIQNIMADYTIPVEFDFEGVNLISSSFADEVFGNIYKDVGPIKFGAVCKFINISSTIQGLLDRAITQRMQE